MEPWLISDHVWGPGLGKRQGLLKRMLKALVLSGPRSEATLNFVRRCGVEVLHVAAVLAPVSIEACLLPTLLSSATSQQLNPSNTCSLSSHSKVYSCRYLGTVDLFFTCESKLLTNRPDAPAMSRYLLSEARTCLSAIELIGCSNLVGPNSDMWI